MLCLQLATPQSQGQGQGQQQSQAQHLQRQPAAQAGSHLARQQPTQQQALPSAPRAQQLPQPRLVQVIQPAS